jgi:hypothetical protein
MNRDASSWNYPWGPTNAPVAAIWPSASCCLQPDGRPYVKLKPLQPAGRETGFAHPRCYLSSSANCSKEIGREHYITRALIARPGLKVPGMPWRGAGGQRFAGRPHSEGSLPSSQRRAVATRRACSPHLREFEKARLHATKRSLSRRNYAGIVSGEALELWALKTMAGLYASGMDFRLGDYRFRNYAQQLENVAEVLINSKSQGMVSLEVPTPLDAHEEMLGRAAVRTLFEVDDDAHEMTAFVVRMSGLAFKFHLQRSGTASNPEHLLRPQILDLVGRRRTGRLYFEWPNAAAGSHVFLRLGEANDRVASGVWEPE